MAGQKSSAVSYHQQLAPPSLTMGAQPIDQPRAPTSHASIPGEDGPMTPWLDGARRKYAALNFPPDVFSKEINDTISLMQKMWIR
jgi:hypothetical protein